VYFSGMGLSREKPCALLILLCEKKIKIKTGGQSSGCKNRASL
jgi:hypothetical protein